MSEYTFKSMKTSEVLAVICRLPLAALDVLTLLTLLALFSGDVLFGLQVAFNHVYMNVVDTVLTVTVK